MGLVHRIVLPCLIGGTLGLTTLGCGGSHSTTPPSIAYFTPLQGSAGNDFVIAGSGFTNTTAVSLGNVACTFTVNNDSQITAFIPTAAQSATVTVTNAGGTSTTAAEFYIVPTVTTLSASTASVGTQLTVGGSGFGGATAVAFYGPSTSPASYPATVFNVVSANELTVTVPTGVASGAGYVVQVTVPGPGYSNTSQTTQTTPLLTIQ